MEQGVTAARKEGAVRTVRLFSYEGIRLGRYVLEEACWIRL